MTHDSNLPATTVQAPRPARIEVMDAIPLLDTGKFEHMWRIAKIMASASLCPDALCKVKPGEDSLLPLETVEANCFLVVNQAVRWQMDPFAVAQCTAVVRGKPCYEGKLIAAVLEAKLGLKLEYEWNSESGDKFGIRIWNPEKPSEVVEGTVADWKTTGRNNVVNGQWVGKPNQHRMLKYRGDREWARMWRPSIMLGVYSPDEMEQLQHEAAARRATPLSERLASGNGTPAIESKGFNRQDLQQQLGDGEKVDETTGEITPAKESADDGGQAETSSEDAPTDQEQGTVAQAEQQLDKAEEAAAKEQESSDPEPDPREKYSAEERKAYEEGAKAQKSGAGPQVPKNYRHATMKHLQAAWTRGFMDSVNEDSPDMLGNQER